MSPILVIFITKLWLFQAVFLFQWTTSWETIGEAQTELWTQFTEAEREAVNASMTLSKYVQNTTSKLYKAADNAARLAAKIKISLFKKSHAIMLNSIGATRCLNGLKLASVVEEMNEAVGPAKRCLHDFADVSANLEKELTTFAIEMRSHTVEAKRALTFCQQPTNNNNNNNNRNSNSTAAPSYSTCVDKIMKEMKSMIVFLMNKINSFKNDGVTKDVRSSVSVRSCLRRLKNQIVKVKSIQRDVLKCKD